MKLYKSHVFSLLGTVLWIVIIKKKNEMSELTAFQVKTSKNVA